MPNPVSRLIALIGLIISSPIAFISSAVIRISSRGPVLHRACRAGKDGQLFTMFKFRTMHVGAERRGGRITSGRDPRVFAVGRGLRRLKLDELPQLINILRGDMAIVGPRPEDPAIVEEHYTPFMRQTLRVLPGLTSPGSLDYYACEVSLPEDPVDAELVYVQLLLPKKIALDMVYVEHRTWRYDVELIARTILGIIGVHRTFPKRQTWEREEASRLQGAAQSLRGQAIGHGDRL